MKFKVNNEEVFASTGGRPFDKKKPLIIFLHGSGFNHTVWMLQTRYFAFHGYSVLALDLPGHGFSGGKCIRSIENMADWLKKLIEVSGCKNTSLIGHSQGCLIGLECAARYPKIIKSLSLIGGSGAMPVNQLLLDLAENNNKKVVDLMMDWSHGPAGKFGTHSIPGMNHINIGTALITSKSLKNTLGIDLQACNNYTNGFGAAKKLSLPTLSILGEQDKMCSLKAGNKLANVIQNNQIHIIKNCGHMIMLEEADQTLTILKKFIKINYPVK